MDYYDTLETRDPAARDSAQFTSLAEQIANAQLNAPAFAVLLAGVEARDIRDRKALAQLPVIRKSDLHEMQRALPPFAGLAAVPTGALGRVYSSPGPVYDPEGRRADYWRMARAMFAAGMRRGDLVLNTFSYHFTPAGFMLDMGAHAIGCAVIPAGSGNTELQVAAIADLKPACYVGTPSFLRIILAKADELKSDASSLRRALVTGEALPPSLRKELQGRGVATLQCYGSADLGLIAYESEALEGMIVDEGVIVEIVRPGTGDPVAEGEVGEIVVTTFNADYPLVRFATGDLSAVLPGMSPCGRTNLRIKGWMGRADQATKVRGLFVHPHQVAEVLRRHGLARARLSVENEAGEDRMTLSIEGEGATAGLAEAVAATVREITKLRGEVKFVAPGSLPNDGKVIEDLRKY
jgi:phenylacetate-CoA ligase